MKKELLFSILIMCFFINHSLGQTDSAYDSIKVLNLDAFASKPVDSLLRVIPKSYNYIKILGSADNNNALGLCIHYPTGLDIWIKPKRYTYMLQSDPNRVWNLALFKKETAHYISITHPEFDSLLGYE